MIRRPVFYPKLCARCMTCAILFLRPWHSPDPARRSRRHTRQQGPLNLFSLRRMCRCVCERVRECAYLSVCVCRACSVRLPSSSLPPTSVASQRRQSPSVKSLCPARRCKHAAGCRCKRCTVPALRSNAAAFALRVCVPVALKRRFSGANTHQSLAGRLRKEKPGGGFGSWGAHTDECQKRSSVSI
jgi:hypothetical protein